ncbi:MAG: hypothetical protein PVG93_00190 [Phycisphaerales bacterium]|jgi:hypothetical protein
MTQTNDKTWSFNKQINLSVVVQLLLLAFLIIGSYVNLQGRLDLLQHDVTMLLQCQKQFQQKLESLTETSISYEYRLQAVENNLNRDKEASSF